MQPRGRRSHSVEFVNEYQGESTAAPRKRKSTTPRGGAVASSVGAGGSSGGSTSSAGECNIGVAVRIRPLNAREVKEQLAKGVANPRPCWTVRGATAAAGAANAAAAVAFDEDALQGNGAGGRGKDSDGLRGKSMYHFDHVLGPECETASVYEKLCTSVVQGTLKGYNGTIFAYGQTSSGKTYSMVGSRADPGMAVLAVHDIFTAINACEHSDFLVVVSYLEIYNEAINDLFKEPSSSSPRKRGSLGNRSGELTPSDRTAWSAPSAGQPGHNADPDLDVFDDKQRGPYVKGATELVCCSAEQVLQAMRGGLELRHMAATDMNLQSSRSHTILRVVVESRRIKGEGEGAAATGRKGRVLQQWDAAPSTDDELARTAEVEPVCMSSLYLVDLAGSESAGRMHHGEQRMQRLKEGSHINKSLLTLSKVINVLASAQAKEQAQAAKGRGASGEEGSAVPAVHVPFRESKLTRLLSGSLGGNARTVLLCCISPAVSCIDETRSTLLFGERAKRVRNRVRVNEAYDTLLSKYRAEVAMLRTRLREAEEKQAQSASLAGLPRPISPTVTPVSAAGAGGAPWSTPRATSAAGAEREALHKLHSLRKLILLSCSTIRSAHPVLASALRQAAKGTRRASRVAEMLQRGDLESITSELDGAGIDELGSPDTPPPPPLPPPLAPAEAAVTAAPVAKTGATATMAGGTPARRFSRTLLESVGQLDKLSLEEKGDDEEALMDHPPLQGTVYSGFLLRLSRKAGGHVFESKASLWVLYPNAICCFKSVAQAARSGASGAVGRFTFGPKSSVCRAGEIQGQRATLELLAPQENENAGIMLAAPGGNEIVAANWVDAIVDCIERRPWLNATHSSGGDNTGNGNSSDALDTVPPAVPPPDIPPPAAPPPAAADDSEQKVRMQQLEEMRELQQRLLQQKDDELRALREQVQQQAVAIETLQSSFQMQQMAATGAPAALANAPTAAVGGRTSSVSLDAADPGHDAHSMAAFMAGAPARTAAAAARGHGHGSGTQRLPQPEPQMPRSMPMPPPSTEPPPSARPLRAPPPRPSTVGLARGSI